jgi:hypothetical protein
LAANEKPSLTQRATTPPELAEPLLWARVCIGPRRRL